MLTPDAILRDHYRITYVVDERADGVICRALDQRDAHRVLIGALPQANAEALEHISYLARQIASVQMAGLLTLRDHFADGLTYYLVADDPGGQDLERVAPELSERLTETDVMLQIERLLGPLEALHNRRPPLLLGDLRPTDLWASPEGDLSLAPFALARNIGDEPSPYRAPELSQPQNEPTTSSDLYALGAVAYHLLTGWAPPTAVQREAGTPLAAPRTLKPAISGLAEQMVLRALEMKPANRYQMAREMRRAIDTVRLMSGRPLGAERPLPAPAHPTPPADPPQPAPAHPTPPADPPQPAPPTSGAEGRSGDSGYGPLPPAPPLPAGAGAPNYQPQPGTYPYDPPPTAPRQNNSCLIAAIVTLAILALGACVAFALLIWQFLALQSGQATPFVEQANQPTLTLPTPAPTQGALSGAPAPTLPPLAPDSDAISVANVRSIAQTSQITETRPGPVLYLPDGSLLALGFGDAIQVRNADTLEVAATLRGHTGSIIALAAAPPDPAGPALLASGAVDDTTIRLWDARTGALLQELRGHTGWIRSLAFSPDGALLASASVDTTIRLWDVQRGALVGSMEGHTDWLSGIAFSPDGALLASTSRDGSVRLWDIAARAERPDFAYAVPPAPGTATRYWTTGVAFNPNGAQIAIGSTDARIYLLNGRSGAIERVLEGHTGLIAYRGLGFSPDGTLLASASTDGTVRIWNPNTGAERARVRRPGLQALSIGWSADGARLAISSDTSGEVLVWDAATETVTQSIRLGQGLVVAMAYSPTGKILGMGGISGALRLRLLDQGQDLTLTGGAPTLQYLAFLNETNLVAASDTGGVTVIDLSQQTQTRTLDGLAGRAYSVAVSPNGNLIAGGSDSGAIILWEARSGRQIRALEGLGGTIFLLAFSSDGRYLTAVNDAAAPEVAVWEVQNGAFQYIFTAHRDLISSLAIQPGGRLIATTGSDGTLRLWDLADGSLIRTIDATADQGWFSSVAFSPDGALLVTGGLDGSVEFWNPGTGERLHGVNVQQGSVLALAFRADGAQLAVSTREGGIFLFDSR